MRKFRTINRFVTLIITSVMIAFSAQLAVVKPAIAVSDQSFVGLTNRERELKNLPALKWNPALSSSAWAKATDMCRKNYWAHTAPDGTTGWTFMRQVGYTYQHVGENLARNFTSDEATMEAWMKSPGHRANILKPNYRDIGIASVQCETAGKTITITVAHYGER